MTDTPNLETPPPELRTAEELRTAHAALERERRRYAELFEVAPDALLVTDVDGRIVEANSATLRMLDVSPDEIAGKVLDAFLPPPAQEAFRNALVALAAGEPMVERDLRLRTPETGERIVHARAVPLENATGETRELRWALRDVTEQRVAADDLRLLNTELEERVGERTGALERQRALLEAVLEQNPLGVAIVDETEQVVLANAAARRILGVAGTPSQVDGYKTARRPYTDDEWPVSRSLATGEVVMGERARIVRPDGVEVVVEVNSGPIRDRADRIVAAVSVFQDVTLSEQRELAERDFVSNAAHELRTPLAAIVGAVEVLQAGAKRDPDERERFLAHLQRQCRRLERLTDALLTLARVETNAEPPRLEIVELRPLLEDVARALHPAPRVSIEVECPDEVAVVGSPQLLEEALLNLASNAVKYTSSGTVTLSAAESPGFVELAVRDTGRGMSAQERERAVERFYRGEDDMKDGFGLGLAIVAAAAKAMGTDVHIESAPGRGTTVSMTLRAGRLVTA